MGLLNEIDSWELLSKTVFGEQSCPAELEEIGKKIGKSCKGFPLSIVVVGGLLSKSKQTSDVWKDIEDNLNSIVNLEDDERCLKILHVRYKQLPVYLKPCFLYMGAFPEDVVIPISKFAKLWVAEGFLKPVSGKVLEDIAKEYLKELVDRNLVLIHKLGCTGNIKQCKIHDLLRDLSLREAEKERFYTIFTGEENVADHSHGRILFYNTVDGEAISHMSLPHSSSLKISEELDYRFTRIVEASIGDEEFLENIRQLVNSRFLALTIRTRCLFLQFWQFWNLQTLIVNEYRDHTGYSPPNDIWCMPSIRHVRFDRLLLPDFPNGEDVIIVLRNLQSLGNVWEFNCSEQVVKRIPNIRKLFISYGKGVDDRFALTNLDRLDRLEALNCSFNRGMCTMNFPYSLKKLTLEVHITECWQVILDKIGMLPLLQKLILVSGTFEQGLWETSEGQFRSLKFLCLSSCDGPQIWKAESSHFPCLEHLSIYQVTEPSEIPLDFAEISTLRLIESDLSRSVMESAKRILEKQEELYGEETTLQVQVQIHGTIDGYSDELQSMATPNFRFIPD